MLFTLAVTNKQLLPFTLWTYCILHIFLQETQIRKLKLSLEPWREIVLYSNKVLLWEQKYYASALLTGIIKYYSTFCEVNLLWLSGITFLFTIILLADPSILTVISLTGLALTLADYFMPLILQSIFKPEMWSGDKQKEFEEICTNIILYKTKAELLLSSYCRMRVTNPKLVSVIFRFIF